MKIVILGLDGATWRIIEPLTKNGEMPNLRSLMEKGSWGSLESTIPPVTGSAWLSLATGLNPGKTGVIDFLKLTEGSKLKLVNSSDFRNISIWDILSNSGMRCVLLDYPMLYPPYKINGIILSSWGGEISTFPKELKSDLQTWVGNYDVFVKYHDKKYDDIDLFILHLNQSLEKKLEVTRQLLKRKDWNIFVNVISHSDWVLHRMWRYIDEQHPLYNKQESLQVMPHFLEFWKKIDTLIGELIPQGDYMFIVSDHGFGSQYGCFNVAKWLEKKGYIKRKRSLKSFLKPISSALSGTLIAKRLPAKIKEKGKNMVSTVREIDLDKSKVYIVGHTIPFGAIYINLKEKNSSEIIKNQEYTSLKAELINSLLKLKNDIDRNVSVTVFDVKELYQGNKIQFLPDIIFTIENWSCIVNKDFRADFIFKDSSSSNRHTGSHRLNGLFLAFGPEIKEGIKIKGSRIIDVAPTILHLFNIPIPKDMDGRILTEIFKPESDIVKRKPRYAESIYNQEKTFKEKTKTTVNRLKKLKKI